MRSLSIQGIPFKKDVSRPRLQQTDQRLEQRCLAHTVAADQADHLAGLHAEVHIPKDVTLAVIGVQPTDLKKRRHPFSSSGLPR